MTFLLLLSDEKTKLPDLYSLHDFIRTFYLGRHADELERLAAEQRPGRPPSKRLEELRRQVEAESREYNEGMDVPDLRNEVNVSILREWKGDPQALPLFRFVRISGSDRCVMPRSAGTDTQRAVQRCPGGLTQAAPGRDCLVYTFDCPAGDCDSLLLTCTTTFPPERLSESRKSSKASVA